MNEIVERYSQFTCWGSSLGLLENHKKVTQHSKINIYFAQRCTHFINILYYKNVLQLALECCGRRNYRGLSFGGCLKLVHVDSRLVPILLTLCYLDLIAWCVAGTKIQVLMFGYWYLFVRLIMSMAIELLEYFLCLSQYSNYFKPIEITWNPHSKIIYHFYIHSPIFNCFGPIYLIQLLYYETVEPLI